MSEAIKEILTRDCKEYIVLHISQQNVSSNIIFQTNIFHSSKHRQSFFQDGDFKLRSHEFREIEIDEVATTGTQKQKQGEERL